MIRVVTSGPFVVGLMLGAFVVGLVLLAMGR